MEEFNFRNKRQPHRSNNQIKQAAQFSNTKFKPELLKRDQREIIYINKASKHKLIQTRMYFSKYY